MRASLLEGLDPRIGAIARDVRARGGRAFVVGGFVRDRLLGLESKDVDVEVFGLDLAALHEVLAAHGEVLEVGRAFGVLLVKGLDVDFSLPRIDSAPDETGDIVVALDPGLDVETAARRRDLTVNAISVDAVTGEIVDPHGGRVDLEARRLRATDAERFVEDPLRGLRVAQLAARLDMRPDPELIALCATLDLSRVAPERMLEELRKLLLRAPRPSVGLEVLRESTLLRFFPELEALIGVPQDPEWHPEGDVWVHTLMVVDEAARLRRGDDEDLVLMLAALCHDLGKPATTVVADRVRSNAHDVEGIVLTEGFLGRLRAPDALLAGVAALVHHHLAPALYVKHGAGPKAYRRLARRLGDAGTSLEMLVRVARADHLGRTTPDALARRFPAGEAFTEGARACAVEHAPRRDAVMGRHLVARGLEPGPQFADILSRCRDLQDETGSEDAEELLDAVLSERC